MPENANNQSEEYTISQNYQESETNDQLLNPYNSQQLPSISVSINKALESIRQVDYTYNNEQLQIQTTPNYISNTETSVPQLSDPTNLQQQM